MFSKANYKILSHQNFLLILGFIYFFYPINLFANEKSQDQAKTENSAGTTSQNYKPREQKNFDEWLELSSKLEKLLTKVKAKRQAISDLVIEKNKEKDPSKLAKVTEDLGRIHKEYTEMIREHEKLRNFILYRFPERANEQKRIYKKIDSESLVDIEVKGGIEGQLSTLSRKIKKQYPTLEKKSDNEVVNKEEMNTGKSNMETDFHGEENTHDRSGVTETIIISK